MLCVQKISEQDSATEWKEQGRDHMEGTERADYQEATKQEDTTEKTKQGKTDK
jgi:hypothetical protein